MIGLGALAGYVALFCAAMIGPAYALSRLGYAKASLAVALATSAALVVDRFWNWEDVTYPHVMLAGPTFFFPLTIIFAAGGVAIGFMACLERA